MIKRPTLTSANPYLIELSALADINPVDIWDYLLFVWSSNKLLSLESSIVFQKSYIFDSMAFCTELDKNHETFRKHIPLLQRKILSSSKETFMIDVRYSSRVLSIKYSSRVCELLSRFISQGGIEI